MSDNEDLLRTAAEQFLGKGSQEIEDTIIQVRAIIQRQCIFRDIIYLYRMISKISSFLFNLIRHWKDT